MLQRTNTLETSRLSVVPTAVEGDRAESAPQAGAEARGPQLPAGDVSAQETAKEEAKVPADQKAGPKSGLGGVLRANRKRILMGVAGLLLAAAGYYGYDYATAGRFMVSTDDAYVRADATTLAAKVSGYVSAIDVKDNQLVHAGDVIATIDDGDYRLAVEAARGKVATQEATVGRIGQQIVAQQATVAQANAQLASAQAVENPHRIRTQASTVARFA